MIKKLKLSQELHFLETELEEFVNSFEQKLFSQSRFAYSYERTWISNFYSTPGIYVGFRNNTVLYIGESADVKERMKETRRTYNHSFRKQVGKQILGYNLPSGRKKFTDAEEEEIRNYFEENITIAFYPLTFGRTEVEAALVRRHRTPGLLNKVSKRDGEIL